MRSIEVIEENKDKYLDQLIELLRIPSVSADPKHKEDLVKASNWLKNHSQYSRAMQHMCSPWCMLPNDTSQGALHISRSIGCSEDRASK